MQDYRNGQSRHCLDGSMAGQVRSVPLTPAAAVSRNRLFADLLLFKNAAAMMSVT